MSQARPERADAVRNRRAILAATEELLATHRPRDVSIEQVAAAAGVGKGTVFHRFGSRMGLRTALMIRARPGADRGRDLRAATAGAGGRPDRERLLAFLDAVIEVVGRNKSLPGGARLQRLRRSPVRHGKRAATRTTIRSTASGTAISPRSSRPSGLTWTRR